MQRPTATIEATARIRQPHEDMTNIPSIGAAAGPPACPGLETAGTTDPLTPDGAPTPLPLSAGGSALTDFFAMYLPRAINDSLDGPGPGLAGADAGHGVHGGDPDLPVADLARASCLGNSFDNVIGRFGRR
jgi:hypothetical protein